MTGNKTARNDHEPAPTALTYPILFKNPVTDEDVAAIADAMLHQRGYDDSPENLYARAVAESSDARRTPKERDYLQRLVRVLDERRPWPTLPYVADPSAINHIADPRRIGTIPLSQNDVEDMLG